MLRATSEAVQQIVLVNHGERLPARYPERPVPLHDCAMSAQGIAQMESAARLLASVPFSAIVHSGLSASRQAADIISAGLDLPSHVDERLAEIYPGEQDFSNEEARRCAMQQAYLDAALPNQRCLQGESWLGFSLRIQDAWAALCQRPDNQCLLVSAHDSVNRMLLAMLCGTGLNCLQHYTQQPGCINILQRSAGKVDHPQANWQVVAMNLVAHEIPGFELDPDDWLIDNAA